MARIRRFPEHPDPTQTSSSGSILCSVPGAPTSTIPSTGENDTIYLRPRITAPVIQQQYLLRGSDQNQTGLGTATPIRRQGAVPNLQATAQQRVGNNNEHDQQVQHTHGTSQQPYSRHLTTTTITHEDDIGPSSDERQLANETVAVAREELRRLLKAADEEERKLEIHLAKMGGHKPVTGATTGGTDGASSGRHTFGRRLTKRNLGPMGELFTAIEEEWGRDVASPGSKPELQDVVKWANEYYRAS